jgi:glycosyltransferase A (GT-A) superfamily protein (DUF2064 family)
VTGQFRTGAHVLVVAKAPVPGQVKTRLGHEVGMAYAARLAAAAMLDTLELCAKAFGPGHCHLALAGDLDQATDGGLVRELLRGWSVTGQRGETFGARLANAHADLAGVASVVQIGMDTPHAEPAQLHTVVAGLENHDAVLAPAEDGGWWALALRSPGHAAPLSGVRMSTDRAEADTRRALVATGLEVGTGPVVRDVDTVADAEAVARLAPDTHFARAWATRPGGAS